MISYKVPKSHTPFSWSWNSIVPVPKSHTSFSWIKNNHDRPANIVQQFIRLVSKKHVYQRKRIASIQIQSYWRNKTQMWYHRNRFHRTKTYIHQIQNAFRKFIQTQKPIHQNIKLPVKPKQKKNIKLIIKSKPLVDNNKPTNPSDKLNIIFSWEPRQSINIKIPRRIKWPIHGYYKYDKINNRTNYYLPLKILSGGGTKENDIYAYYDKSECVWIINNAISLQHYRYILDYENKYRTLK